MLKFKNLPYILLILGLLGISSIAFAEGELITANTETSLEEVTAEELSVQEPNILPDNPLYFLKDWARNIQSFFTLNSVKKIELKNKFANEKLLEAKKLVEKNKKPEIIKKTLEKYQETLIQIKDRADKIKEGTADSSDVQKFLEKFEAQKKLHQRILQKLETKVPEQTLEKIEESRQKHLENFEKVMQKLQKKEQNICTTEFDPVCGKDGKTYSNQCVAKTTGIEINYKGECKQINNCGDGICADSEKCIPGAQIADDCGPLYCPSDCK